MNKNIQANNLKTFRQKAGLTQQQLADSLKVKQTKIKDIETGKQKIPVDFAITVEKIHHVNFKWLLTGEGEMFEDEHLTNGELTYQIPIRGNVEASCGYGVTVYEENVTSTYSISKKFADDLGINPKSSEIIFARGDSMEPTIQGGDCLLIDKSKTKIYDGKIYCTRIDGEVYAKRLQKIPPSTIYIVSDNSKYKGFEVDFSKEIDFDFEVIGEVRWWGRIAK